MNITDLLDRPIAYHRVFVTLTGSVKAAIMLSQAMYWQRRAKQTDGWWYKTAEEWEEETGLSRREQEKAREDCAKFLKTDLRDVPARLYWQVDEEALTAALFGEKGKSSFDKKVKLDSTKSESINRNTETTTEIKQSLPVDWKIAAGMRVTEEDLQTEQLKRDATTAFERDMSFGSLPWWSTGTWEKFGKFVTGVFRQDHKAFTRYNSWRMGDGKYAAFSNRKIRENPLAFMDTGWPEFEAAHKPTAVEAKKREMSEYERRARGL